jgi:16S rRNA (adenine1518-N6/adenine1519-N6)-dimethyltransferase
VLEVGPGPGGLTRALLDAGAERVIALERDPRCVAALAELAGAEAPRLEVIEADALAFDLATLDAPLTVVANLPYNVATALLLTWLERLERISSLTLMFQREVAERLVARPRSPAYGRLSVLVQWLCRAEIVMHLPAGAFLPPPKVASSLVRLVPREAPLAPAAKPDLERVVAAGFGQRRKMLRTSLKSLGGDAAALLDAAGIEPTARAEEIDVAGFCRLARAEAARRQLTVGSGTG